MWKGVDWLSPAIGLCWGQDSTLRRCIGALRLTFFEECAFLAIVLLLFTKHFVEAFRIYFLILLGGHGLGCGFGLHEVSDVRVFLVELLLELGNARHGSISRLAILFLYSNKHRLNLVTVLDQFKWNVRQEETLLKLNDFMMKNAILSSFEGLTLSLCLQVICSMLVWNSGSLVLCHWTIILSKYILLKT